MRKFTSRFRGNALSSAAGNVLACPLRRTHPACRGTPVRTAAGPGGTGSRGQVVEERSVTPPAVHRHAAGSAARPGAAPAAGAAEIPGARPSHRRLDVEAAGGRGAAPADHPVAARVRSPGGHPSSRPPLGRSRTRPRHPPLPLRSQAYGFDRQTLKAVTRSTTTTSIGESHPAAATVFNWQAAAG